MSSEVAQAWYDIHDQDIMSAEVAPANSYGNYHILTSLVDDGRQIHPQEENS
jgi:hypothetical protein